MDSELYQLLTTKRNLRYNVFYAPSRDCKPTLVFLHGSPNFSYDWHYQVEFFSKLGYGIVAPDLLGSGGTDKPLDTALYKASGMAKDMIDIFDRLGLTGPVIPIGHDWGSKLVSRLANSYQDRFAGFGFMAIGYIPPDPVTTYEQLDENTVKLFGRELYGYWAFYASDEGPRIIKTYYNAWWDALLAFEPETIKAIQVTGGWASYLPKNISVPLPVYIDPKDAAITKAEFKQTGLKAPLNWYKVITSGLDREDAALIPQENYTINKPVFFAGAINDMIGIPEAAYPALNQYAPQLTAHNYSARHWVQWEKRDELNRDLNTWIGSLGLAACAARAVKRFW